MTDITFADIKHGWAVGRRSADDSSLIVATSDGGVHWTEEASPAGTLWVVTSTDAEHAWSVGDGGLILATSDGGTTWVPQQSGTSNGLLRVAFSDAQHGWILVYRASVLATSDGGETWTRIQLGPEEKHVFVDIAAVNASAGQ